ncbi:MAG: prepilin-type N-terminal cleavage/methylation domain-containing protein [Pseudomonadota bacterium]
MRYKQGGFTLVEIAIVLVIIGLLLGGVLKGQELINSAKVKNFANDFRTIPIFLYSYQDKFKALPGDDTRATTHLGAGTVNGDGDGLIEGDWNTNLADAETCRFWQHVRLANLANGPTSLPAAGACDILPTNADGGILGIEAAYSGHNPYIQGMTGTYFVCTTGVLGKYVRQLDQTMDDGNTAAGSMRAVRASAGRNSAAENATNIVDSDSYIVCLSI